MHVKPCLEKLNQDADHDVQHFANEAYESKFNSIENESNFFNRNFIFF